MLGKSAPWLQPGNYKFNDLAERFELKCEAVIRMATSSVKLKAAENDCLVVAEETRNLLHDVVKGDHGKMQELCLIRSARH